MGRWYTVLSFLFPCASCLQCYSGVSSFGETTITAITCQDRQCVKIIDFAGAARYGCDELDECGRALEYSGKITCPPSPHLIHGKTCCCETDLCNWKKRIGVLLVIMLAFIHSLVNFIYY